MFKIKNDKLKMYVINKEYKEYLYKYDKKVSLKDERKFYGILVTKDDIDYYIPFTSKVHKNTSSKLTVSIKSTKGKVIAKLLLNNMIPVDIKNIKEVNINESKYKTYYINEIRYLRNEKVKSEILTKLDYIFDVLCNKNHFDYKFFKEICCNFKLLERKCFEYEKLKLS